MWRVNHGSMHLRFAGFRGQWPVAVERRRTGRAISMREADAKHEVIDSEKAKKSTQAMGKKAFSDGITLASAARTSHL